MVVSGYETAHFIRYFANFQLLAGFIRERQSDENLEHLHAQNSSLLTHKDMYTAHLGMHLLFFGSEDKLAIREARFSHRGCTR